MVGERGWGGHGTCRGLMSTPPPHSLPGPELIAQRGIEGSERKSRLGTKCGHWDFGGGLLREKGRTLGLF